MLPAIYNDIILEFLKNKRLAAIFVMYFLAVSLLFVQITQAFFSDTASSLSNTFAAAAEFPPLTSAALKINEFSSHGGASIEWVELINPTGSSVDVSGWSIEDNNLSDVFPTVSPIPPGGFAVVVPNSSSLSVPGSAVKITLGTGNIGNGLADDGDRIILKDASATEIDKVSYGDDTFIFPTPVPAPGASQSAARIPNGFDTDSASDWQIDSTPTVGTTNSL
ncbi:MAG: lamin tail domain-containing protein [bacterium]|nr:lamin tail domain-containing protein [bacterium]